MVTGASVYFLHSKCLLLSIMKINRGWCWEASTNLANRTRSIQLSTRTLSIDTHNIATPEHLKRQFDMLMRREQIKDNKYTVFGLFYQMWPLGSDKIPVSALLDLV